MLNWNTGARELGFVHIYVAKMRGTIIYVGQTLDIAERRSGHLQGSTQFDVFLRKYKEEITFEVLEKVRDSAGGLIVTNRELDLIDQYGTWVELGVGFNVRTKNTWRHLFAERFEHFQGTIDFLGGDGPYSAVRDCRRLHLKGEHTNWYKHRVYKLFPTLERAQENLSTDCEPLNHLRCTEAEVRCDKNNHFIVQFFREKGQWVTKQHSMFTEAADVPW